MFEDRQQSILPRESLDYHLRDDPALTSKRGTQPLIGMASVHPPHRVFCNSITSNNASSTLGDIFHSQMQDVP